MTEIDPVFPVGNWQMYRDSLDVPLGVLSFFPTGEVFGGSENEKFWSIDDGKLQIFGSDRQPTTVVVLNEGEGIRGSFEGKFIGTYQNRSDIKHIFRKCGNFIRSHRSLLPLWTKDPKEALEMYRDNVDFSFVLSEGEEVRSGFHGKSAYVGNGFPDFRRYVFDRSYRSGSTFVHVLNDATLVGGVVAVTAAGLPIHETTYQAELRSRHFSRCMRETEDGVFLDIPQPSRIEEKPSLLLNTLGGNYGHWHVQSLANLMFFRKFLENGLGEARDWVFYMTNGYRYEAFRAQSIGRMGYGTQPTADPWAADPAGCISFRKLVVPSLHRIPAEERFPATLADGLAPLRDGRKRAASAIRLYLSRKDIDVRRNVVNEKELMTALSKLGFTPVVCGALSYVEQERIFSGADVILAPHGGALTNMAFTPAGATVIELFHGLQFNAWYKNLANILGHRYGFLGFDPPEEESARGWHASFAVDVDAVADLAETMIADAR